MQIKTSELTGSELDRAAAVAVHVGDSAFEDWYSEYQAAHKCDKQRARDAYAAGMGDCQAVQDSAYSYAVNLATSLFKKHYASDSDYASKLVTWEVCDSTVGVISQIDNMVTGLIRKQAVQKSLTNGKIADDLDYHGNRASDLYEPMQY